MNRPVDFGMDGPPKRSYLEDFWCFAVLRKEFSLSITSGHVMVGRGDGGDDGSAARGGQGSVLELVIPYSLSPARRLRAASATRIDARQRRDVTIEQDNHIISMSGT